MLLAGHFTDGERRAVGWSLLLVGALSTIPLAAEVLGGSRFTVHPEAEAGDAAGAARLRL